LPALSIREILAEGISRLKSANLESPSLDASLLLAEALGVTRERLAAAGPEPAPEEARLRFGLFIGRRLSGECVAYILGRKEFRGLDFTVGPAVLVPRPDTETLVEAALDRLARLSPQAPGLRILDLCTGSGAVAISLKRERPDLEVWAADISAEALAVARSNAARLLPAEGQEPPIRFARGNLFDALEAPPAFSLITANPPYVPSAEIEGLAPEVKKEPRLALDGGADGLDIIRNIAAEAPRRLCPGGCLLLEADPRQMPAVAALLEARGFRDIQTRRDLSGRQRVIGGLKL
jgi:release factor glutamine methyltransferase